MTLSLTSFPGTPDSVAAARRFVAGVLRACPQADAPEEMVDRAELIVSELATNAIRHTRSGEPGQTFRVHVYTDARGLHVQVHTLAPHRGHSVPRAVSCRDPWAEHGRGLLLVDRLATAWGTLAPWSEGVYFHLARDDLQPAP